MPRSSARPGATSALEINPGGWRASASIDSQILVLKGSGADTFANFAVQKFAPMAIKKAQEIGWKPMQVIMTTSSSVPNVLAQAGPLKESIGLITGAWYKAPSDPKWANDEGVNAYKAFMKARLPGKADDAAAVHGYLVAALTFKLLERAGDNLTRENLLKQATSMTNLELPMLLRCPVSPSTSRRTTTTRSARPRWRALTERAGR